MTEQTSCTPAEIETYRQTGYLVAKSIVPLDEIAAIHEDIAEVLISQIHFLGAGRQIKKSAETVYSLMRILFDMDQKRYLACLRLISRLYSLQKLMMYPGIAAYAKALGIALPVMQSRTVFHVMSHELKFSNGYFGFDAHQDWPALQSSLDTITAWIPLVDIDKDLFPIEVIPGSHMQGLRSGGVAEHINTIAWSEYEESAFVPIEAARGDVIFMTAFNLHRSALNGRTNNVRLAASCRYENAKEKYVIEHGYPFCQQLQISRELIVQDFPSQQQVADIFKS